MKKSHTIGIMVLFVVMVIPNLAFASWWNPLTWKIFYRTDTKTQVLENRILELESKLSIATTTISTSTPKTVATLPPKKVTNIEKKVVKKNVTTPGAPLVVKERLKTKTEDTQNAKANAILLAKQKDDEKLKLEVANLDLHLQEMIRAPRSRVAEQNYQQTKQEVSQDIVIPIPLKIELPQNVVETPSYTDLHCPKVVSIEDSLGNTANSRYLRGTFKKGDVKNITVTISASDPQNLPLYYQYSSAGLIDGNSTIKDWSGDRSYSIDVTNAILGTNRILFFGIDNQDKFSCAGDYMDIHGSFTYTVTP